MDPIFLRALAAGSLLALASGPLGTCLLWRKMAFYGDALAHSALFGVAAGLCLGLSPRLSVPLFLFLCALFLWFSRKEKRLTEDTRLAILSQGALALGLVIAGWKKKMASLEGFLFGDILAISSWDLWMLAILVLATALLLFFSWKGLILSSLYEDVALAEGQKTGFFFLVLLGLAAALVSFAAPMVGALLVSAFLVIPAASAHPFCRSPEAMAWLSILFSLVAQAAGLSLSWLLDLPAGPAMVAAALGMFLLARLGKPR